MFEQTYSFGFEAAHELAVNVVPGHDYAHVHGHSFEVTVTLTADGLGDEGWVTDFADVRAACENIRALLDHRFLNRIDGLEQPTLERLGVWIYERLRPDLPRLTAVAVGRPSLREAVRYAP